MTNFNIGDKVLMYNAAKENSGLENLMKNGKDHFSYMIYYQMEFTNYVL